MSLFDPLSRDSATVVTECRRCGTTVDRDAAVCPVCGSEDIAEYTIR